MGVNLKAGRQISCNLLPRASSNPDTNDVLFYELIKRETSQGWKAFNRLQDLSIAKASSATNITHIVSNAYKLIYS